MMQNSLFLRLVASLLVAQTLAFIIAWAITLALGLMGFGNFDTSLEEIASIRARRQVIASLIEGKDGQLLIRPTEDLQNEIARVPSMKFAAFNARREPLPGSSPELVSEVQRLIEISPTHVHFILPGDPITVRSGLLEPRSTPYGRLHIAVYGQKFHWVDILPAFEEEASWLVFYLVTMISMSCGAAWIAVRWSLQPLRRAAARAARIDMDSLHQRLDSADVSTEIAPFVDAVNGALERLDEGVARQRRFTANAAHELRTPVAILTARIDAPKEPSFLVDIERDARRIHAIVEQMLSSARLSEGDATLEDPIDLVETASAVVADAALLAIKSRHQIAFEPPDSETPVWTRGSRVAIESIIQNLIHNALSVEPEGGALIVRVGEQRTVEVIDHGPGIPEAERRLIFEPFWRKHDRMSGTGLGLAITKELIERIGGRIAVEETAGGGATFRLQFKPVDS